jgi:hypothetical protein
MTALKEAEDNQPSGATHLAQSGIPCKYNCASAPQIKQFSIRDRPFRI